MLHDGAKFVLHTHPWSGQELKTQLERAFHTCSNAQGRAQQSIPWVEVIARKVFAWSDVGIVVHATISKTLKLTLLGKWDSLHLIHVMYSIEQKLKLSMHQICRLCAFFHMTTSPTYLGSTVLHYAINRLQWNEHEVQSNVWWGAIAVHEVKFPQTLHLGCWGGSQFESEVLL